MTNYPRSWMIGVLGLAMAAQAGDGDDNGDSKPTPFAPLELEAAPKKPGDRINAEGEIFHAASTGQFPRDNAFCLEEESYLKALTKAPWEDPLQDCILEIFGSVAVHWVNSKKEGPLVDAADWNKNRTSLRLVVLREAIRAERALSNGTGNEVAIAAELALGSAWTAADMVVADENVANNMMWFQERPLYEQIGFLRAVSFSDATVISGDGATAARLSDAVHYCDLAEKSTAGAASCLLMLDRATTVKDLWAKAPTGQFPPSDSALSSKVIEAALAALHPFDELAAFDDSLKAIYPKVFRRLMILQVQATMEPNGEASQAEIDTLARRVTSQFSSHKIGPWGQVLGDLLGTEKIDQAKKIGHLKCEIAYRLAINDDGRDFKAYDPKSTSKNLRQEIASLNCGPVFKAQGKNYRTLDIPDERGTPAQGKEDTEAKPRTAECLGLTEVVTKIASHVETSTPVVRNDTDRRVAMTNVQQLAEAALYSERALYEPTPKVWHFGACPKPDGDDLNREFADVMCKLDDLYTSLSGQSKTWCENARALSGEVSPTPCKDCASLWVDPVRDGLQASLTVRRGGEREEFPVFEACLLDPSKCEVSEHGMGKDIRRDPRMEHTVPGWGGQDDLSPRQQLHYVVLVRAGHADVSNTESGQEFDCDHDLPHGTTWQLTLDRSGSNDIQCVWRQR